MRRDEERELRLCAWDDETELTNPVSQSWCIGVQVTLPWHGEDNCGHLSVQKAVS